MTGQPQPAVDWAGLGTAARWRLMPRDVRLVVLGVFLFNLGFGLTLPFLLVYLHQARGLGTATVGLLFSWMALLGLLGAGPWGALIDRRGPRAVLAMTLVVEGIGVLSLVVVDDLATAVVAITLIAVGGAGGWPAQTALLSRLVPEDWRTWLFGFQFMLLNLGIGIGGLVAASVVDVDKVGSFQVLYVLNALGYVLYLGLLALLSPGAGRHAVEVSDADAAGAGGGSYRDLLRDRAFLRVFTVAVILVMFGYAQLEVGLTAYVTQVIGLPARWLGVVFAVATTTIVVAQLLVLRRLEGRSRSLALAAVGVLWGASWAGVVLAGLAPTTLLVVAALGVATSIFSIGETLWAPSLPALVNDLAPDDLRGRYNAVSAVAWNVGNVVGPLYAGALIGSGNGAWWAGLTILGCLVGAGLAARMRSRIPAHADGRTAPDATMPA